MKIPRLEFVLFVLLEAENKSSRRKFEKNADDVLVMDG